MMRIDGGVHGYGRDNGFFALLAFGDIYFLGSMVRESEKKAHDAIGV
jgi:hypothetical protein